LATSNQYLFPLLDADYIIRDAFFRCGIKNAPIAGVDYQGARFSLDYILSHWLNYGLNLFTVYQGIIPIVAGQTRFELPQKTLFKIMESNLVKVNQILGGTANSSAVTSGSAASVFQTTPGACLLSTENGYFTYTYPQGQPISYVGVLSNTTQVYELRIEASFTATPAEEDWILMLDTPSTTYYLGQPQFWVLPFQKTAVSWRISEIGGAILDIAQISLDIPYQFQPQTNVSRDLYFRSNTNNTQGAPANYWHDRAEQPSFNVYPWADSTWQFFIYNYINYIQDIGDFTNSVNVPGAFLEALTATLASKLSLKHAFDRYDKLKQEADDAYRAAGGEDTEKADSVITMTDQAWYQG